MEHEFDKLSSENMSDILHLVLDKQDDNVIINEVAHTEFMTECLNHPFIGDCIQEQIFVDIPDLLKKSFIINGKQSLSELLFTSKSALGELRKAKSYFNNRSKLEKEAIKKEVYVALYYALIAAALVYHQVKITQHSISNLQSYFRLLLKKNWIPETVKQIYIQAGDYLVTIQSMDTKNNHE